MESARRPFGRSLAKEPGLKKARITEDPAAPDRSSNGRVVSRPMAPKILKERDSESVDAMRGTYQYQPSNQLHQELVNQYKTALSELTFNSKPIITNLTIIAGENSQAAKAIAATICANVLEVPREQKLPSLYLLDSIVKNFGRDYIKHFAPRLPEVFCKAYKLVDPSTHQNMRHLFGTWKGVFPPQTLQMIEKELGLTSTANGSSSGTTTSKPDVQAQRPANSIHVNPKYLEARHRLQTTRNIQHHQKDQVNDPVRDKIGSRAFMDPVYGSDVSGLSGRVSEGYEEQELDRPFYESGSDVTGNLSNQKNGFDRKHGFGSYAAPKSATTDSHLQLRQNSASRSWKNSEEEEYMWDEMNTGPTDRGAASMTTKKHWTPDSYERSDFESHLRQPGIDDEATTDSMSTEMGQVASGTRQPLSWSGELHPPAERMQSGPSKNISGYSEGYSTGLKNSSNTVGKPPFQSQLRATPKFAPNVIPGPKVSMAQQQTIGERNLTSAGPPTDPRRPSGQRNTGSRGQFTQDSLPLPSTVLPPLQQKKHVPTHKRKLEVSEFESTGEGRNLPQISGSESRNSSSDQSNPLTIDSPGQSITSSLLSAVAKSGIFGSTSKKKLEQPPLTPTSNPVSNLLSTLMAKGLISASKSDSLISSSTEKPNQPLDRISGIATSQSTPESSTSMTMSKSLNSTKDDMSSFQPVPKVSDDSPKAEINMKNLIGFDFRPDVVRKFQPHVVSDLLSDPPHQCTICGLRLQFQEQLDRHMECHALRVARTWYSSSADWVSGANTAESQSFDLLEEESDEALESSVQMVPADESQCACILCGEMFEDFYSRERKEWMFKEAVFLTKSESGILGPIVHVNCISEHSVHDLGLACDVKLEKDL